MPPILSTSRLDLRELVPADAPFIRDLLNDPDFLRFIGDRGVRTAGDAVRYIENGPRAMYAAHGYGLLLVEEREGGTPVGMCGLLRREGLDAPDLGFAFLPAHRGKGYASEAGRAALAWAREERGIERVLAITSLDNHASGRVLEKLGFRLEGRVVLPGATEELNLYGTDGRVDG